MIGTQYPAIAASERTALIPRNYRHRFTRSPLLDPAPIVFCGKGDIGLKPGKNLAACFTNRAIGRHVILPEDDPLHSRCQRKCRVTGIDFRAGSCKAPQTK
ncbi:hypothetical protein [Sphingobium abikonense]|uniref:hypothetical protein n=1 Tax=Sphingobium abikonense TaxID=86193 RepID=UPI003511E907